MRKKEYLTVYEISKSLELSTRATMKLVRSGELQAHKFGSQVRISAQSLAAFIEASRIQAGKGAYHAV